MDVPLQHSTSHQPNHVDDLLFCSRVTAEMSGDDRLFAVTFDDGRLMHLCASNECVHICATETFMGVYRSECRQWIETLNSQLSLLKLLMVMYSGIFWLFTEMILAERQPVHATADTGIVSTRSKRRK